MEALSKQYEKRGSYALQDIHLSIDTGEFVVVLGRSGSGKSTLIRCINRIIEPTDGEITWMGAPITGVGRKRLKQIRSGIGMIFQHFNLLPRLDVMMNVTAGMLASRSLWPSLFFHPSKREKEKAVAALRQVGLTAFAGKRVEALSGGQKQRVAIARVITQRPELLLADEPVSSLDPVTAVQIMDLILDLHKKHHLTVVMNLHDIRLATRYATRIIGLSRGRIVFDGKPDELTEEHIERIYPPDEEERTVIHNGESRQD